MGNLFSKFTIIDYKVDENIPLTHIEEYVFINQINEVFMKGAYVKQINQSKETSLNSVKDDMLKFFNNACDGNSKLIIDIDITVNNTRKQTEIEIKIMENRDQDLMIRGISEIRGTCLYLFYITDKYDVSVFKDKGWKGMWYNNGRLCGKIRFDENLY